MPTKSSSAMSSRERIIDHIAAQGGRITSPDGRGLTSRLAAAAGYRDLGVLNAMLSRLETEGVIQRDIRGRRTFAITLVKRSGARATAAPRKKSAPKKAAVTKRATGARKTTAKRATAKKAGGTRKAAAKRTTAKKAAVRKAGAKRTTVKRATAKKTAAKKSTVKKAGARKATKRR
jgi:hypothetical protein